MEEEEGEREDGPATEAGIMPADSRVAALPLFLAFPPRPSSPFWRYRMDSTSTKPSLPKPVSSVSCAAKIGSCSSAGSRCITGSPGCAAGGGGGGVISVGGESSRLVDMSVPPLSGPAGVIDTPGSDILRLAAMQCFTPLFKHLNTCVLFTYFLCVLTRSAA